MFPKKFTKSKSFNFEDHVKKYIPSEKEIKLYNFLCKYKNYFKFSKCCYFCYSSDKVLCSNFSIVDVHDNICNYFACDRCGALCIATNEYNDMSYYYYDEEDACFLY